MNAELQQEAKEIGLAQRTLKIIVFLFKVFFPAYILIQMNFALNKASKFYKNPWFGRQIRRNFIVILILSSLFLLPLIIGSKAIQGNKEFNKRLTVAKESLSKDIKRFIPNLKYALSEDIFLAEIKIFGGLTLFGMLFGNFIIFFAHDLIINSRKFAKILKNEGVINRENSHPLAVWTPIGVLVEISGSAPKEISLNERIWLAMNMEVKDWAENPDKRSLVFFKTSFKLQSRYDYQLPKEFK